MGSLRPPTNLTTHGTMLDGDPWTAPGQVEPEAEADTQIVQGLVEGAEVLDDTNSIEFFGERFRLRENIALMPLMRFAAASKKGLDSDDLEGLAAMYTMLRGIIERPPLLEPEKTESPDTGEWEVNPKAGQPQRDENGTRLYDEKEWLRFQEHAENIGADGEDLMGLVGKAMGVISARPRQRRAVSSSPSPTTSPSSRESSSSPGTTARPDLDLSQLTQVTELGR